MESETHAATARFLTLAEVAEILRLPLTDVAALVRSHELPGIRVGRRGPWRVERSDLELFLAAAKEESRRLSLWEGSDFAAIPELSGGVDNGQAPEVGPAGLRGPGRVLRAVPPLPRSEAPRGTP